MEEKMKSVSIDYNVLKNVLRQDMKLTTSYDSDGNEVGIMPRSLREHYHILLGNEHKGSIDSTVSMIYLPTEASEEDSNYLSNKTNKLNIGDALVYLKQFDRAVSSREILNYIDQAQDPKHFLGYCRTNAGSSPDFTEEDKQLLKETEDILGHPSYAFVSAIGGIAERVCNAHCVNEEGINPLLLEHKYGDVEKFYEEIRISGELRERAGYTDEKSHPERLIEIEVENIISNLSRHLKMYDSQGTEIDFVLTNLPK